VAGPHADKAIGLVDNNAIGGTALRLTLGTYWTDTAIAQVTVTCRGMGIGVTWMRDMVTWSFQVDVASDFTAHALLTCVTVGFISTPGTDGDVATQATSNVGQLTGCSCRWARPGLLTRPHSERIVGLAMLAAVTLSFDGQRCPEKHSPIFASSQR